MLAFINKHDKRILTLYVLLFILAGFLTLPFYGFTWDEAVGDVFFGERYFHFWTTLNPAYLDFERTDLDVHQRAFNLYSSTYRDKPSEFLPTPNTVSGATMEIFSYKLHWLDPVDGFHFGKILLAALLLWVMYNFVAPRLGKLTAALSVLILSTYPRFWADSHFNPLDISASIFFAITLFAFYIWTERPTWRQAMLTGILFGLALGSKSTTHFVPVVAALGTFPWQMLPRIWTPAITHIKNYWAQYVAMPVLGLGTFFAIWPYFYGDPMRLTVYYNFVLTEGFTRGTQSWNLDPLIQAITTMPEIDLILFIAGIGFAVWGMIKQKSRLLQLLLVWLAIPIIRTSMPGAANFDGIRHFQEFVPAACLLAAYGGASIVNYAARFVSRKMIIASALAVLIIANFALIEAHYFPYDYLYYNSFVGGLRGMQQNYDVDSTDYWGGSYRHGIQWLNANAEAGAQLHVAIAPWIVRLVAPIWLRSDIGIIEEPVVKLKIEQGYPVYTMFITRPGWYNNVAMFASQNLKPVYQIDVDGATVLVIYKLN